MMYGMKVVLSSAPVSSKPRIDLFRQERNDVGGERDTVKILLTGIGGGSGSIGTATLVTVHAPHSRDAAPAILVNLRARILESESPNSPTLGL